MLGHLLFFVSLALIAVVLVVEAIGFIFPKTIGHDMLGRVKPDESVRTEFDGVNIKCVCKYCGKKCLQDSSGEWFHTD